MSSEMEAEGGGSSDAMPLDVSEEQPAAQPVNAATTHHKATADSDLPWVEKYRPSTMDELIAHDEIISIITRLIEAGKLPHLLFYGPPGTGKVGNVYMAMNYRWLHRQQQLFACPPPSPPPHPPVGHGCERSCGPPILPPNSPDFSSLLTRRLKSPPNPTPS